MTENRGQKISKKIESFRDLNVYKLSFELQQEVFILTKKFPKAETQHWLDNSLKCKYISIKDHRILLEKCRKIGRMFGKMMAEPEKWCSQSFDFAQDKFKN